MEEKTIDSKYIQQHLANERTFLAWIRTGITIVGLGFLASGAVFRSTTIEHIGHWVAAFVGIAAVIIGSAIMALATKDYFAKRKGINEASFRSPGFIVLFVFSCMACIDLFLIFLVILLLFY